MSFFTRHKKLIVTLSVFIICTLLTIGLSVISGHTAVDMEARKVSSILWVIISFVFILAYFVMCMVLRVKKQREILSGLLLYQLAGMLAFVIHLILLMADEVSFLSVGSTYIFYWWSLPYHEAGVLLMNLLHFHIRYVLMLFVGMMTYVTAKCLRGIQLDNAFEKKVQEKKETEAQAEEEAKNHRIISAKEVEAYNENFTKNNMSE